MTSYRAYRLDERHRITSGQWLNADNDAEAKAQAVDLCEEGASAAIELWQATRLVDEIDCPED